MSIHLLTLPQRRTRRILSAVCLHSFVHQECPYQVTKKEGFSVASKKPHVHTSSKVLDISWHLHEAHPLSRANYTRRSATTAAQCTSPATLRAVPNTSSVAAKTAPCASGTPTWAPKSNVSRPTGTRSSPSPCTSLSPSWYCADATQEPRQCQVRVLGRRQVRLSLGRCDGGDDSSAGGAHGQGACCRVQRGRERPRKRCAHVPVPRRSLTPSRLVRCDGQAVGSTVRRLRSVCPSLTVARSRAQSRAPIQVLDEARDAVQTLHVDGTSITAGSVDGYVRTYDLRKGELRADFIGRASFSFSHSCMCTICLVSQNP